MDGPARHRGDPPRLLELLEHHLGVIEETFDLLSHLNAFDVELAAVADADHWRHKALELRARLSLIL